LGTHRRPPLSDMKAIRQSWLHGPHHARVSSSGNIFIMAWRTYDSALAMCNFCRL
jgi:hypothetical protein